MNFEVLIKFNVDSNEVLEKEINFEYYKHVNSNNEDKKEENNSVYATIKNPS